MAAKKSSSTLSQHSYNDFAPGTADEAQWPVDEAYATYEQCMKMQNDQGDSTRMVSTPNSESGNGIMGGVAPGEPDPTGYGKHATGMGDRARKK